MLSRLAFRNAQAMSVAVRGIQTTAPTNADVPRPKRRINISPVKYGFIPEEWFTFFYPKTGVSGPYAFLTGVSTFLISKEYYILDHEFYNAISLIMIAVFVTKRYGPAIAAYLDKSVDKIEEEYNNTREMEKKAHQDRIDALELEMTRLEGQKMIYDIKRQNILMQLEAIYRERAMNVYSEVKKRLDFHTQLDAIERRIAQKHMVQWIVNSVLKAITPEQEKANLQQCIKDLEALAAKA